MAEQQRGPFEKFMDSPFYSVLELSLASDVLLTTLHPLLENVNGVIR
jgi:hypothetical protein